MDEVEFRRRVVSSGPALRTHVERRISASLHGLIDADDVAQDGLIKAYRILAKFKETGPGSFDAWLQRIADHVLAHAIRDAHAQKRGGAARFEHRNDLDALAALIAAEHDANGDEVDERNRRALRMALASLSDERRTLIELHYLPGRTVHGMAEAAGMSEATLRGQLSRALQDLRQRCEDARRFLGDEPR